MTQYVFTLSSRMVAIASTCVVFLGILLFLLGVEIGKLWAGSTSSVKPPAPSSYATPADPVARDTPSLDSGVAQNKAP